MSDEKKSCWICGGPVPNALNEGQYEGPKSLLKKDAEICTFCANAERHAMLLSPEQMETARKLRDNYDLEGWKDFINGHREQIKEMYGRGR